jgi:hypothetical protein
VRQDKRSALQKEAQMLKPLKDEQADMRLRWLDPAYRWQNDSALRKKLELKEPKKESESK